MKQEKQLSERESLQLISRMIYEAKGYFHETGLAALVYGFSVVLLSLLAWMRARGLISIPFHPFYLMIPVFFFQSWVQLREQKKKKAKTFTDEAIDYVWMGYFLSVFASFTAVLAGHDQLVIPVILLLTGFAVFLTGMLSRFRYHVVVSVVTWLMASVSFFIRDENRYVMLALAAVIVWIIPGFILNAHLKKHQHG